MRFLLQRADALRAEGRKAASAQLNRGTRGGGHPSTHGDLPHAVRRPTVRARVGSVYRAWRARRRLGFAVALDEGERRARTDGWHDES